MLAAMARKSRADARGDMLQGTLDMLVLQDPHHRARPRPHHRACHREGLRRGAAGGTRVALSRAASARGSRTHRRVLGNVREQPQGQVLPDHAERAASPAGGAQPVAAARRRGDARARTGNRVDDHAVATLFRAKQARRRSLAGNRALHRAGDRRQHRARHER